MFQQLFVTNVFLRINHKRTESLKNKNDACSWLTTLMYKSGNIFFFSDDLINSFPIKEYESIFILFFSLPQITTQCAAIKKYLLFYNIEDNVIDNNTAVLCETCPRLSPCIWPSLINFIFL